MNKKVINLNKYFLSFQTGRCLIAGRDIKPLEIIFKDKPAVIAPNITDAIFCCMCLKVRGLFQ